MAGVKEGDTRQRNHLNNSGCTADPQQGDARKASAELISQDSHYSLRRQGTVREGDLAKVWCMEHSEEREKINTVEHPSSDQYRFMVQSFPGWGIFAQNSPG